MSCSGVTPVDDVVLGKESPLATILASSLSRPFSLELPVCHLAGFSAFFTGSVCFSGASVETIPRAFAIALSALAMSSLKGRTLEGLSGGGATLFGFGLGSEIIHVGIER